MVLTKNDFEQIRYLIQYEVKIIVKEELKEVLGSYPTKDEFYNYMDKLFGEIRDMRQEFHFC
jgi:hypothetical protein